MAFLDILFDISSFHIRLADHCKYIYFSKLNLSPSHRTHSALLIFGFCRAEQMSVIDFPGWDKSPSQVNPNH